MDGQAYRVTNDAGFWEVRIILKPQLHSKDRAKICTLNSLLWLLTPAYHDSHIVFHSLEGGICMFLGLWNLAGVESAYKFYRFGIRIAHMI